MVISAQIRKLWFKKLEKFYPDRLEKYVKQVH